MPTSKQTKISMARESAKIGKKEQRRLQKLLRYENELWGRGVLWVAGVDEVGVGPLAGPVVAAVVILKPGTSFVGIDDSKKLKHEQRTALAPEIRARAQAFALGSCSPAEIDEINILQASFLAMRRALAQLAIAPHHLLVDGRNILKTEIAQTVIIKGDAQSQSIAAASILAKVERDALMARYALEFPLYGFERHKGYGTALHMKALREHGPCAIHRRSFAPVMQAEVRA